MPFPKLSRAAPVSPAVRPAPTLDDLIARVEQCERDSERHLGHAVALRLGHWRDHCEDVKHLSQFLRRFLYKTTVNGWALHQKGGLTLEAIVIDLGEPLFSAADIDQARQTLGLAGTALKR